MGKSYKKTNATSEEFEVLLKSAGLTKTDFAALTNAHRGTVVRWNKIGVPRSMITWLMMYARANKYTRMAVADAAGVPSNHRPAL